jgi:hypothetical protein
MIAIARFRRYDLLENKNDESSRTGGSLTMRHSLDVPSLLGLALAAAAGLALGAGDVDEDTVANDVDNCITIPNTDQRDSNGDGFGNLCDGDLNNDLLVNAIDLRQMLRAIGTAWSDADLNGDGTVTGADVRLLVRQLSGPPGPGNGGLRQSPVPERPQLLDGVYALFAANDLGMHCADLDYQIFSILPPFNVAHAQVIRRGTGNQLPALQTAPQSGIEVAYSAASNPNDPALADPPAPSLTGTARAAVSINSTSRNDPVLPQEVFKGNFWAINPATGNTFALDAYRTLFPGDVLALFDPIPPDLGLPAPDPNALPELAVHQAAMPSATSLFPFITQPYTGNTPQPFDRFDTDFAFFPDFPFGGTIRGVNWWAVDGIPITPTDDAGRRNPFPLMRVEATADGAPLATLDVVVPVSAEADCIGCHVVPADCRDPRLPPEFMDISCNGAAVSPTRYSGTEFEVRRLLASPGDTVEQQLFNAAKLNVLALHDAKHGGDYTVADGSAAPCHPNDPGDPACLVAQTPLTCAQCHYSPALDLAQAGPVDEPEVGDRGRQQTRHVSMSRAMHYHHGEFPDLFPDMPPIVDEAGDRRPGEVTTEVLERTCYSCHPGKRTQCLRGAMFNGGMVCQDCHGGMLQVGNDFSRDFPEVPYPDGIDLTRRVPWASEPNCASCHTGDALTTLAGTPGTISAPDGIRLLQAWPRDDPDATPIEAPDSRFAETEALYRFSSGHGGVNCEGCHGSTHAIWPIDDPDGNDNVAALQLQGHRGAITECTVCHNPTEGGLPLRLGGPHGMHPVADWNGPDHRWNSAHEDAIEREGRNACRACHGRNGEGTVLASTAKDRLLRCKEDAGVWCRSGDDFIVVAEGTPIRCDGCHENEL